MRPAAGGDCLAGHSRKSSFADHLSSIPLVGPGHGTPTTYFLTNEAMLQRSRSNSRLESEEKGNEYGVQSLGDTIGSTGRSETEEEDCENDGDETKRALESASDREIRVSLLQPAADTAQIHSARTSHTSPYPYQNLQTSQNLISQPTTPLFLASPAPGSSLPSSPKSTSTKSFRPSDEESIADDAGSQAVASSGEEDMDLSSGGRDGGPQLVMPSIMMPSRRPFTARGKNMGRLKVLVAGDSGVGKTSLIKSIVQTCEDIVHVDPLSTTSPSLHPTQVRTSKSKDSHFSDKSTKHVSEVYASTKAYPSWWSEFEENKVLRRRKSTGETVLERNLCFVDTPGYRSGTSFTESIDAVIRYVESQMARTAAALSIHGDDLLGLLSGQGGSHVDVVFYLILKELSPVDIQFLQQLSTLTNIIPIVAKSDTLSTDQVLRIKKSFLDGMKSAGIRPFLFGMSLEGALSTTNPGPPFAVSSAVSNDSDNMDASVLMSSDYVQPLIPTELSSLVDMVFERDTIAWLRHSASKKFMRWQSGTASSSLSSQTTQGFVSAPSAHFLVPASCRARAPYPLVTPTEPASSFTLARIADHRQREEQLAQVRLAKWATDLRRSLQNERERFEALARGERAVWLTERLGQCVIDGTLLPSSSVQNMSLTKQAPCDVNADYAYVHKRAATPLNPKDPLGLIQWNDALKRRGWIVVEVMSSFGIIGGLAMWLARNWGMSGDSFGSWDWHWWGGGDWD
ncbi:MAG: hypothetical protein M1819_003106 [Sarea resinae]|nr:MAG: hypothetical protein M1819_003106 [Sarea resinae]